MEPSPRYRRRLVEDDTDRRIVSLVVAGEDNRAIARALGMPLGTVKWRIHRLYRRAEVTSRTQFVLWVVARGPDEGS
ncbi:MAG: Bacterial regulatory protein luxR family [Frankiaceae bacterium]|nr:Bacterial regulatory protein luxR family [Frankiaceae bacterium]